MAFPPAADDRIPGIRDPVPPRLGALLRRAVQDHAGAERRRVFGPLVHVGTPGQDVVVAPASMPGHTDHTLRTDVLAAMLHRTAVRAEDPIIWVTRAGDLTPQDIDLQWLAAASSACAEAGRTATMVVVVRQGWRDPRTGTSRTWSRLRRPATDT